MRIVEKIIIFWLIAVTLQSHVGRWESLNVWNKNFNDVDKQNLLELTTLLLKFENQKIVKNLKDVISRFIRFKWLKF